MRFKGLTFGTLGLVLAFLLYLALNFGLQTTAKNDAKYATAVIQLVGQVSSNLSLPESKRVIDELSSFKSGKSVQVAGDVIDTYTLAGFLSPETSSLWSFIC